MEELLIVHGKQHIGKSDPSGLRIEQVFRFDWVLHDDISSDFGRSALTGQRRMDGANYACRYGLDTAAIKLLEWDDIQVNLQDKRRWTALMFACRDEMETVATKLSERDDIHINRRREVGYPSILKLPTILCLGKSW
jgi:hypothetical protein